MKLFGTDGIRGRANSRFMNPEAMLKIGAIIGKLFTKEISTNRVIIGKDTRVSGYMIENAITSGFLSSGKNVILTGPVPTPAVSFLTKSMRCDLGVMISASHNPYYDNGVKFFLPSGEKFSRSLQAEIEHLFFSQSIDAFFCDSLSIGRAKRIDEIGGRYIEFIKGFFPLNREFRNLRVVLDCANGANYKIAPEILWELGIDVIVIGNNPNGNNINDNCGSTHLDLLRETVIKSRADIGIALDGDGDRIAVVDENGIIGDGDSIIAAISMGKKKENSLKTNNIVTTHLSNGGMDLYLKNSGFNVFKSGVGDYNVYSKMLESDSFLGGEESGHVILRDAVPTGDGLLVGIQLLHFMIQEQKTASELLTTFTPIPQYLDNIRFDNIPQIGLEAEFEKVCKKISAEFKDSRLIVRMSGTENLIRIMAETNGDGSEMVKMAELEIKKLMKQNGMID
jgi:phosphoglucosamine mutase